MLCFTRVNRRYCFVRCLAVEKNLLGMYMVQMFVSLHNYMVLLDERLVFAFL